MEIKHLSRAAGAGFASAAASNMQRRRASQSPTALHAPHPVSHWGSLLPTPVLVEKQASTRPQASPIMVKPAAEWQPRLEPGKGAGFIKDSALNFR